MSKEDTIVRVDKKEEFGVDLLSQKTFSYMCQFKPTDVRYMIVKDDNERIELIRQIEELSNWTQDEKDLLSSKILTHAIIKEDI